MASDEGKAVKRVSHIKVLFNPEMIDDGIVVWISCLMPVEDSVVVWPVVTIKGTTEVLKGHV